MDKSYRCEKCGVVFQDVEEWTEEEREAEMVERFGPVPMEDRALVCDNCFNAIMANFN